MAQEKFGCPAPQALNYDPRATKTRTRAECAFPRIGCLDSRASNYDATVNVPDLRTCEFDVPGCMMAQSINFEPRATVSTR